jgi:integrase
MMIKDYVNNIYSLERAVSAGHKNLMLVKVRRFSEWLGHEALLGDLNSVTINRFLEHRETVRANATVIGERAILRSIWAAAVDSQHLATGGPSRLRRLRREEIDVCGWDEKQLSSLLLATENQPGMFRSSRVGKVARAPYWRAFFLTAYDTGLRLGDVLRLTSEQIVGEGSIRVKQHKTGKLLTVWISREAFETIRISLEQQPRKLIFGDVLTPQCFHKAWRTMIRKAGLRGGTKYIRRTSGSMIEKARPGQGHLHLGNGATVFARHYRVDRLVNNGPVLPPRIVLPDDGGGFDCGGTRDVICG